MSLFCMYRVVYKALLIPGWLVGKKSARLVIERLRVRIPAGAAGEFSSPESTLCAESYSVSVPPRVTAVARKRPRSFCQKCRKQVKPKHAYTLDPSRSEWADHVAVQAGCWSLSGKGAHTQLLSEHSVTVVSAR